MTTDDSRAGRLYTEAECAAILRRAAELDAEGRPTEVGGLSLDALREVAASAGLDPLHVEAAAAELDAGPAAGADRPWSLGPTTVTRERVLEAEIDAEQWQEIAALIRSSFPDVGTTQLVGHSLEWTGQQQEGTADQVSVEARDGRVRIRVYSDFTRAVAPLWPLRIVPLALCVVLGVTAGSAAALGAAAAWLALTQWGSRRLCRSMLRRRDERARALLARLQERLGSPPDERAGEDLPASVSVSTREPTPAEGPPRRADPARRRTR